MDYHCERFLMRLYKLGRQDQRDLRDRTFEGRRFHPKTLTSHLGHLRQGLVEVERTESRVYYELTRLGELVAGEIVAREVGMPVAGPRALDGLIAGRSDWDLNVSIPGRLAQETIQFRGRKQIRELRRYGKQPYIGSSELRLLQDNLANLSSCSVTPGSELHAPGESRWETIEVGRCKLPAPVENPGLNPNNWQQIARRRFELESTFNDQLVKLPNWFQDDC